MASRIAPSTRTIAATLIFLSGIWLAPRWAGFVLASDPAPKLKYQWKADQTYQYLVHIQVTPPTGLDILEGTVRINAKPDGNSVILTCNGAIENKTKPARPGRSVYGPGSTQPWVGDVSDSIRNTQIRIDEYGRIKDMLRPAPLPLLLGDPVALLLVHLSPAGAKAWEEEGDRTIEATKAPGTPRAPLPITRTGAKERVVYKLGDRSGSTVSIVRTSSLKSEDSRDEDQGYRMTCKSTVTFDVTRGIPTAMEFTAQLRRDGKTWRAEGTYTLQSSGASAPKGKNGTDLARMRLPDMRKRLSADEIDQTLEDLKSSDKKLRMKAIRVGGQRAGRRSTGKGRRRARTIDGRVRYPRARPGHDSPMRMGRGKKRAGTTQAAR
jgi:hypothetical protein